MSFIWSDEKKMENNYINDRGSDTKIFSQCKSDLSICWSPYLQINNICHYIDNTLSNIKKAHGLHRLGSDFQISILLVTFHIWKNLLLFVTYWSTISIINVFYSLYMLLHNWRRFQRRQELVYNNRIFSLVFYTGDGGKRSLQKLDNAGYLV